MDIILGFFQSKTHKIKFFKKSYHKFLKNK